MRQFTTFFKKEWLEAWSSFKLIWMPLVFILLGITEPIMNYFMEDILSSVGNLPEGVEMVFPDFTAGDILLATTSQFQSIGVIIFVAIFASAISRERQSGTATLLYVRPITFTSYFMSKWAIASLIGVISVVLGYCSSMYYTYLLYGAVDPMEFIAMVGTYIVWLLFVISFTLAMSAVFVTSVSVTISIIVFPIGLIINSIIGSFWTYTPWKLGEYGAQIVTGEIIWKYYTGSLILTILLMIVCIIFGILMSQKNAYKTKI